MPARARGSYLGCVTANRPNAHFPGTASGVCFDLPNSPSRSLVRMLSQVVRPHPVHHRIRLSPSLCAPRALQISQVPTKGFQWVRHRGARQPLTITRPRVAFGRSENLGAPKHRLFDAIRPAHMNRLPTLRLTPHGVPDARLAERRGCHGGLAPPAFRQFAWHTRSGLAQLRHPAPRTMVSLLNGTHCERLAPLGEDRFCVGARSGPMSCVPGDFADQAICATAVPFHIGIGAAPGSCR